MPNIQRLSSAQPDFAARLDELLAFEGAQDESVERVVADILADVKKRGDAAVLDYTRRFDRLEAPSVAALEMPQSRLQQALAHLAGEARAALEVSAARVRAYHEKQKLESWSYREADGTLLGQQS